MKKAPAVKRKSIMGSNKFIMLISLLIAFIVWVAVAMYKSPEESYTIYNVPIVIDTENSIVSQRGYTKFWQSDEAVDVTVTGPRYMITALTADDLLVRANLNTVDSAGISALTLRVTLRDGNQDITISSQSKTSVEVYFDAQLQKTFDVELDTSVIPAHIAEGYELGEAELTVSSVTLTGPETEVNKVVQVVADPQFPEELMFQTATIQADLNLEGASAADTLSVNRYVTDVDEQNYFVNININRLLTLAPTVELTGTRTGTASTVIDVTELPVRLDTDFEYDSSTLSILSVDYSALVQGTNTFTVRGADLTLPEGITLVNPEQQFNVVITLS